MKYKLETLINKPRADVWKAFDDPQKMKSWQSSLVKHELIEGISGKPGAVSKLTFEERGREYSLTERVTKREEPNRLDGIYENEFADNTISNVFVEQGPGQTLWIVETDFKFKTLFMKIVGPLMKKNFVIRTERQMQRFKEMVESA